MALIERDFGLRKLLAAFRKKKSIDVEIGIIGKEAESEHHSGFTNAELGTIHEFGRGVPERSFLRSTIQANQKRYQEMTARAAKKYGIDSAEFKRELELVGLRAVADTQKAIADGLPPPYDTPNAPSTIKGKRGSSKPLIDRGDLRRSITHRVVGLE